MLAKKHGKKSFSAYTQRNESVQDVAKAYDDAACQGDSRTISTSYVNEFIPAGESATVLPVVTESPDEDYGIVSVGISAVYQSGLQGFLAYERWVGLSDIEENLLTIGVRMPF